MDREPYAGWGGVIPRSDTLDASPLALKKWSRQCASSRISLRDGRPSLTVSRSSSLGSRRAGTCPSGSRAMAQGHSTVLVAAPMGSSCSLLIRRFLNGPSRVWSSRLYRSAADRALSPPASRLPPTWARTSPISVLSYAGLGAWSATMSRTLFGDTGRVRPAFRGR